MGSKISKQKQMFSLLNYKFPYMWEDSHQTIINEKENHRNTAAEPHSDQLLNKVYNFYKSIIQNLSNGLIALDLEGGITFANQPAAQLLDYDRQELLQKNIKEIFGKDEESQKSLRALFISEKRINEKEVHFNTRNGSSIRVGFSSSHIHDENNEFDGVIVLFRDLTEIHHLKIQIEKMERLALIGELSAGIAHEIRNPLAGIKAAAQLLQEGGGGNGFSQQVIERIIREVDRANKLLMEFFKFAKPSKPKLKFHDIDLIIDGVALLLAPQMKKSKVELITQFGEEISEAYVDDTQMEQVIINLFLNAIDAMPQGGKLKVKTYRKLINILGNEKTNFEPDENQLSYVFIEICDNGVGISQQNLEKIFNPFFTTKKNGLGLGLPICSRLVSENGGNLDIQSENGKGAIVTVALPAFVHS
ncbi:MAG: PAS domain-containing protein [bacterium]|nr:MAG: PAS domain-containing protein [bacterium]